MRRRLLLATVRRVVTALDPSEGAFLLHLVESLLGVGKVPADTRVGGGRTATPLQLLLTTPVRSRRVHERVDVRPFVDALLEAGADPRLANGAGRRPFGIGGYLGRPDLVLEASLTGRWARYGVDPTGPDADSPEPCGEALAFRAHGDSELDRCVLAEHARRWDMRVVRRAGPATGAGRHGARLPGRHPAPIGRGGCRPRAHAVPPVPPAPFGRSRTRPRTGVHIPRAAIHAL